MKEVIVCVVCVLALAFADTLDVEDSFPLGYPWLTWGELSYGLAGDYDQGWTLDGYAEQGVDWIRTGPITWNTFVGLRLEVVEDGTTNKWGPWFGAKGKYPVPFTRPGWYGQIEFGIRWENYYFFDDGTTDRTALFAQWSLGGDWVK